jgi:hypothetical protein
MKPIMVGYKPPSAFLKMRQNRVNHERAKLQRDRPSGIAGIMEAIAGAGFVPLDLGQDDDQRGPLQ